MIQVGHLFIYLFYLFYIYLFLNHYGKFTGNVNNTL